jgi:hypothetical protein
MSQTYSKGKKAPQYDNFLEALRDLGKTTLQEGQDQVKKAFTSDVPDMLGLSSHGTIKPNESFSVDQLQKAEAKGEQQAEVRFTQKLNQMRDEERARLVREESQNKEQIKAIQAEIANLTKAAGELFKEVEIAAVQAPVNPGIYHKNFFFQLKSLIVNLRRRVQDSKEWLSVSNSRASKRGAFWGGVKKSGTSYMLSSERYTVMSTG